MRCRSVLEGSGLGRGSALTLVALLALLAASGCSIKRFALNKVADMLAETGDLFASDDDPELVRDAVPFALKTIEGLSERLPQHRELLLSACSGFTQYSYAFVETDAVLLEGTDFAEVARLQDRALRLYLRGRDYCMRSLELEYPGIGERLLLQPEDAVAAVSDVPLLFWTGASWGAAISLGKDRPELAADLPAVIALMRRGLELDETYDEGAIHEVMITLESLPANMGGSYERARQHYERALELSAGRRASTYTALASNVSQGEQNRGEFEQLLGLALAIDPDEHRESRLQNLIVQRRARHLLKRVEDLFLEPYLEEQEDSDEGSSK